MKKLLIIAFAMVFSTAAFAGVTKAPSMAKQITIKAAKIEAKTMGPMGNAVSSNRPISTEAKMEIFNNSAKPVTIIAAKSPIAEKTQLHTFVKVAGKEQMKLIRDIIIPAHKDTNLTFNGLHVMLIGLKDKLRVGQQVPISLIFADGSHLNIEASVIR